MRKILATLVVVTGIVVSVQGLAGAASSSQCRTVYAEGTDTSNPPGKVVVHMCDRIKIDFVIGTQGQSVPDWNVSRQPARKVMKFLSKRYGSSDPSGNTATQRFLFRTEGRGKTSVKFRETTASSGNAALESFTVKIIVLPRRTGL